MNSRRNARILILSLIATMVYAAALGAQKTPDKSPPVTDARTGQNANAKDGSVPIAIPPFILEYQYANLYLRQAMEDNPDFIGIAAMIQEGSPPLIQLSLSEKEGTQTVYYTNSQARAELLKTSGKTAYATPIEYKIENSLGEETKYTIALKDRKAKSIRWDFVPSGDLDESWPGVALLPQPLRLVSWKKAKMAGEGTVVQIDNVTSQPKELPDLSNPPWYTAYAGNIFIDAIVGGPVSGNKTWQVKTAPQAIGEGAKWVLTDEHNSSRQLKVVAKQGNEVTIQEVEINTTASPMTLRMRETTDGLSLVSVAFGDGTRSLRLSFSPDLNIAGTARSGKKSSVTFQVDVGGQSKVIEGVLEAERKGDLVELIGHPSFPEEAKPVILRSKVTLIGTGYKIESNNSASAELPRTSITEKE